MKLNTFFSLMAMCTCLGTSSSFAMDQDYQDCMKAVNPVQSHSLETQLKKVSTWIAERKSQDVPVKMIVDEISDEAVIFCLDIPSSHPTGGLNIRCSNNLSDLSKVAQVVGSTVAQLVVRYSTYQSKSWTINHLQLCVLMLEKDGEFIFAPYVQYPRAAFNCVISMQEEITAAALQALNRFNEDDIPSSYSVPWIFPSKAELEAPEVQEKFKKYQPLEQFECLSEQEYYDKQCELGVASNYHPYVFRAPHILREKIAQEFKNKKIKGRVEREIYLPHIQKILEKAFREVTLAENVSLPFSSRYNDILPFVFSAKNPR